MLIRFSVENFLSFNERQTFSMLPGKGTRKVEHKTNPVKGISVLKTTVLFGANASGKSNLVKAIAFGRDFVVNGYNANSLINYSKFRLNKDSFTKNSRIEFEIQANGKNYAYGFVFNNDKVVEEWLYEVTKKKDNLIFERNTNKEEFFNIDYLLKLNASTEEKMFLNFTAKGTPDNQLFLRELITRKVKENVKDISDIINVFEWFAYKLKVIFPDDKYKEGIKFDLLDNDKLSKIFEELLQYFGTGIDGICLKDIDIKDVHLPSSVKDKIKDDLLNKLNFNNVRSIISTPNYTYFVSNINNELHFQKFMTLHKVNGADEPDYFDTHNESDGTNRIIDYIPLIIDLLKGDNVFIIDEMERSLHPNLIYDIFDLFLDYAKKIDSQLIVASHESSLLTQKLFRKDEIWFVVKNELGESLLSSLEEYNIRFDKEIRKDYLLGRFKAIPRIGDRYQTDLLNLINNG